MLILVKTRINTGTKAYKKSFLKGSFLVNYDRVNLLLSAIEAQLLCLERRK